MERRRFRSEEVRAARASRFAAQLSDALYELGLTHKELADELGVPRYTVDSWTRGDDSKIPGEANLARLCALLELRKPGSGRGLASIAGLAGTFEAPAIAGTAGASGATASSRPDMRLLRPAAHPDLSNIPIPLTSFVGREAQIAEIRKLLTTARLLTLTGPGGIGKTRLSLRVGAEMLPAFPDGVWLVELASLTDPDLVAQVVARTLGVREQPGRPLAQELLAYLRPKRLLLIIDNCEHLVDACAALAGALLGACPSLTILATSRETLRVPGEVTWKVPALSLPDTRTEGRGLRTEQNGSTRSSVPLLRSGQALFPQSSSEAVRLFIERASASRPDITLTDESESAVVRICRRLDGVPLAIELAAACLRFLSLEQIAEQLNDRFRLLVAGSRLALPRHQTLQATIDWSYDLLAQPERLLFQRLSVFAGGWSLASAEAVCAEGDISEGEVLGLLIQLADKSLVVVEEMAHDARYRMLETIREYAKSKLEEEGDDTLHERMVDHFTSYVEAHERDYDALELETPNLLASLQLASERGLTGALISGANAFYHFLETRGLYGLAETLLRQAVEAYSQDDANLLNALLNLGRLEERRGDYSRAEAYYQEGLALARSLQDMKQSSALLQNLGGLQIRRGDYAQAEAYLLKALDIAREGRRAGGREFAAQGAPRSSETGDSELISAILGNLGSAAGSRGDFARAEAYFVESLGLARAIGNRERMCALLLNLGVAASNKGDYVQAQQYYQESLQLARQIGHRERTCHLLQKLGELAAGQGDREQAEAYYHEGLILAREIENRERICGLLADLGVMACDVANYEQAESYFQESLELARVLGHQRLISKVLCDWGELYLARQQARSAAGTFDEALSIAQEAGSRDFLATALYGLARAALAEGNFQDALAQGRQSLEILEAIGHTKVDEVRRWLDALTFSKP